MNDRRCKSFDPPDTMRGGRKRLIGNHQEKDSREQGYGDSVRQESQKVTLQGDDNNDENSTGWMIGVMKGLKDTERPKDHGRKRGK